MINRIVSNSNISSNNISFGQKNAKQGFMSPPIIPSTTKNK